jgi:hypothetical protein
MEFLKRYFQKAIEVTKDFEPVFVTAVYDDIPLPNLDYVFDDVNSFIEDMDTYSLEEIGSDIVGYIYEELIPDEERHLLGQFYTPPPIAEFIVKWAVRNPNDLIMDPAVGSGTFLVKAYKRLVELKLDHYRRKGMKARPAGLHKEVLSQLYADDINPFPAHLTAMNLAMRDVRYPTSEMNVIVEDFFNIGPKQKILAPYVIRTPAGEFRREVIIPKVDVVVANPPYTRWVEIPKKTQDAITYAVGEMLKEYGITGGIGTETGIYVHFISYAHDFLKKNGRLGMIISSSWLQADYGINFVNFLLDHFKIKAVIDFNQRLFRIPLVATCVLSLEKEEDAEKREKNDTLFLYVDKETKVEQLLDIIVKPDKWKDKFLLNIAKQKRLPRDEKWITVMFKTDEIENAIRSSPYIKNAKEFLMARYGNMEGVFARGGTGGNVFFYLTKDEVEKWRLQDCTYPLICSSRYSKFFTLTREDWRELKQQGKICYVFMAHKRRNELPENVKKYVEYGETELKTKAGKTCDKSMSSLMRKRNPRVFYGWYDLGGVQDIPIFATRYSQYAHRFTLVKFPTAIDEDFIALVPMEALNEQEIKALLAYLNSNFTRFIIEILGRTTGGGMSTLEPNFAENLPIINVKKLKGEELERLSSLFESLEKETRKLSGADTQENLEKLQPIVEEIDASVAEILRLKKTFVKKLRTVTQILAERRISRTLRARPEAVKGEEEPRIKPPEKKEREIKKEEPSTPLTKWIPSKN